MGQDMRNSVRERLNACLARATKTEKAIAMLFGWRWTIILGLVAGAVGLSLYNAGPAAFGLLLSLMRLVRR